MRKDSTCSPSQHHLDELWWHSLQVATGQVNVTTPESCWKFYERVHAWIVSFKSRVKYRDWDDRRISKYVYIRTRCSPPRWCSIHCRSAVCIQERMGSCYRTYGVCLTDILRISGYVAYTIARIMHQVITPDVKNLVSAALGYYSDVGHRDQFLTDLDASSDSIRDPPLPFLIESLQLLNINGLFFGLLSEFNYTWKR